MVYYFTNGVGLDQLGQKLIFIITVKVATSRNVWANANLNWNKQNLHCYVLPGNLIRTWAISFTDAAKSIYHIYYKHFDTVSAYQTS